MKKFRGFTLIESLFVIMIIGIISTAIFNMRNIGKDYNDYRKEAVNVIYKEINQSLKDLQRNKVWKDPQGYTHKISSFQISFVGEQTKKQWEQDNTVSENDTEKEFTIDGIHYKIENGVLYVYNELKLGDIIEKFDDKDNGEYFGKYCEKNSIEREDGIEIYELDIKLDTKVYYMSPMGKLTLVKKGTQGNINYYALIYGELPIKDEIESMEVFTATKTFKEYQKVDDQKYKIQDNQLRQQTTYGRTPLKKLDSNPNPVPKQKPEFLINNRYGKDLEIGNIYLYCMDSEGTIIECSSSDGFNSNVKSGAGFYDYVQLIKNRNYTSSKKIKNIDDFEFILSGGYGIEAINLLPDGKIAEGDYISGFKESIYNMNYEIPTSTIPNTNDIEALRNYCLEARTECKKYANAILDPSCTPRDKMCCRPHITLGFNGGSCNNYNSACCPVNDREESSLLAELRCLNSKRYYELNCDEILATTEYIDDTVDEIRKSYTFTVYAYYKKQKPKCDGGKKQRQPVGQITINTITKAASMALCNNDRETNGIDCGGRLCQNNY